MRTLFLLIIYSVALQAATNPNKDESLNYRPPTRRAKSYQSDSL